MEHCSIGEYYSNPFVVRLLLWTSIVTTINSHANILSTQLDNPMVFLSSTNSGSSLTWSQRFSFTAEKRDKRREEGGGRREEGGGKREEGGDYHATIPSLFSSQWKKTSGTRVDHLGLNKLQYLLGKQDFLEPLKILASQISTPISASMGLLPDSVSQVTTWNQTRTCHNLCFVLSNSTVLFIGSLVNFSFIFFIIFSSSTDISHLGKTTYTFEHKLFIFQGCRKKPVLGPFPRLLYFHGSSYIFLI